MGLHQPHQGLGLHQKYCNKKIPVAQAGTSTFGVSVLPWTFELLNNTHFFLGGTAFLAGAFAGGLAAGLAPFFGGTASFFMLASLPAGTIPLPGTNFFSGAME